MKITLTFTKQDEFLGYVNKFKSDQSKILVDDMSWTLRYESNFDNENLTHSAIMRIKLSYEWKQLKKYNEQRMDQYDLVDFLWENVDHIDGPIKGVDLLANLEFNMRLDEIIGQMERGRSGFYYPDINEHPDKKEIPKKISLKIPVIKNQTTYKHVDVFLKIIRKNQESLFFIKIANLESIEDEEFDHVISEIRSQSKIPVLFALLPTN